MPPVAETSRLLDAASFASRAHHGQMRKDGKTPYVSHVFRVCLVARDVFGFDDHRVLITALLHDTIEDTTTDFDDIEERYGQEIARWVAFLTKNKAMPDEERERDYIERLLQAPWQVQACKLADVFDNLSDLGQLPPDRRQHSLERAESYIKALASAPAAELRKPLSLVMQLLSDIKRRQT
jgi:guanosine-3',5'-bis(diphosphate) 3'-pyrophosphohydrolase